MRIFSQWRWRNEYREQGHFSLHGRMNGPTSLNGISCPGNSHDLEHRRTWVCLKPPPPKLRLCMFSGMIFWRLDRKCWPSRYWNLRPRPPFEQCTVVSRVYQSRRCEQHDENIPESRVAWGIFWTSLGSGQKNTNRSDLAHLPHIRGKC